MSMRERYDDRPRERDRRGNDYVDRDKEREFDRYDRGGRGGYERARARYDRSRSRSPIRDTKERERDRSRERERAARSRDSRSPEYGRGRGYNGKEPLSRYDEDARPKAAREEVKGEVNADDDLAPVDMTADMTEAEIQMMLEMGIPFCFDTTQGKGVEDANAKASGIKTNSKRSARQFMNRRGGFNRPLPAERTGHKVIRD